MAAKKMANTPAADAKVAAAMRLIEEAQNTLDRACQALCPVRGLVREWREVGVLSDKCKAMWHRLNEISDTNSGLSLDSEAGTT